MPVAADQYLALLTRIKERFEIIDNLQPSASSAVSVLETVAFHMRKIVEGIAFGCLVAYENGMKTVPRDAQGQWNAERIFVQLGKKEQLVFPEPFERRNPGPDSPPGVSHYLVPNKAKALSIREVRDIYRRLHVWLHEWNPYVPSHEADFPSRREQLLRDVPALKEFLWSHMIGIGGEVFLGILADPSDGQVHVVSASANVPMGKY